MINHVMFIKCYERSTKGKGKNALDITTDGRALCEEEEEEEEEDWDDTNMTGLPNLVRKVGSSDFTSQYLFLLLRPFLFCSLSVRDGQTSPHSPRLSRKHMSSTLFRPPREQLCNIEVIGRRCSRDVPFCVCMFVCVRVCVYIMHTHTHTHTHTHAHTHTHTQTHELVAACRNGVHVQSTRTQQYSQNAAKQRCLK
jgi:hypothetical protein